MTLMEAFKAASKHSGEDLFRGALWGILPGALFLFTQGLGYGLATFATITAVVYVVRIGKNASALRSVARSRARREANHVSD